MASFHLQIATADGLVFDGEADRLVVRTTEGDVGILRGHIDYLAALQDVSVLRLTCGGETRVAAVSGGFVSVSRELTLVNAITLEWSDQIDKARAQSAKDQAQAALRERKQKDQEYRMLEMKLKRALNRIRVAEKE